MLVQLGKIVDQFRGWLITCKDEYTKGFSLWRSVFGSLSGGGVVVTQAAQGVVSRRFLHHCIGEYGDLLMVAASAVALAQEKSASRIRIVT